MADMVFSMEFSSLRCQGGGLILDIVTVGFSSSLSVSCRDTGCTGVPGQLWVPTQGLLTWVSSVLLAKHQW